ncbi:hypothetical protein JET76_22895 [Pseudomonas putida]|uniref:hypothetical protein n=1 Tax=Pseudomonas putida TaxID=303 RepID=UPI0018E66B79|nr:hypothetical protein [Pseudomonas putida]MBI6944176.1 hypothetical protein [Pseudomonas putida]MBI6960342.1 hypothetical protein [Pseudomonas putida]
MTWTPADQPPPGAVDCWSAEVVTVSNRGRALEMAYFHGSDGACWQRPREYQVGEVVAWWCPMPPAA